MVGRKTHSDEADGVLVFTVISMVFIMILFSSVVMLASALVNKHEYSNISQDAAQASVKSLRANGSIGGESVAAYLRNVQSNVEREKRAGVLPPDGVCTTVEVDGKTYKSPYIVVTVNEGRGKGSGTQNHYKKWQRTFEGHIDEGLLNDKAYWERQIPIKDKNHVIEAVMHVAVPNPMSMFGVAECNQHKIFSSAIAFGSQSDLRSK